MISPVLITGVTGFIGSHVAEELINKGVEVIGLKRKSSDLWRLRGFEDSLTLYNMDEMPMEEIFDRHSIQGILHLATFYKKDHQLQDISPMIEANLTFPVRLLDMAVSRKVKLFVNTGTFFEYSHQALPLRETSEENPFNLYGTSKLAFEKFLKYYSRGSSLKVITLKIFYPYGPRDQKSRLIPHIITRSLQSAKIPLSDGFQKLDFVYVKDIARAYERVLERFDHLENQRVFNIASGFPYSIREIVSVLEGILEKPLPALWGEKAGDIPISWADLEKTRDGLGWEPQWDIKRGLKDTVEYYQSENSITGH